jgi:hypothetical protein
MPGAAPTSFVQPFLHAAFRPGQGWATKYSTAGTPGNTASYQEFKSLFEPRSSNRKNLPVPDSAYRTSTFTTAEIVVSPDVPLTVKAARPAGVPDVAGALEL